VAWEQDHLQPVERLLFRSGLAKVGRFNCGAAHPCFSRTAPLDNDVFAFVRNPVLFRRNRGVYRFAEPGGIVLHRAGSEIERRGVKAQGDDAWWFGLRPDVFVETLERHGLSTTVMGEARASDPLLRHRLVRLARGLELGTPGDLAVEETVLGLFDRVCAQRAGLAAGVDAGRPGTATRHRRLVDSARVFLAVHAADPIGLDEVARAVGASLHHLCRVFRHETGMTLHAYRVRQRLGRAVERLAEGGAVNLSELALELGFSSHSHLSRVFRQQVGVPPSSLRR